MSFDLAKYQSVINDGLNMDDYMADKQRFQSCGACLQPYSTVLTPLLLECGHFSCEPCWTRYNKLCPHCNSPKAIKLKRYIKLLTLQEKIRNQQTGKNIQKVYSFAIKLNDSKVFSLQQISGAITFRQLFSMIPQFYMYQKALKGQIILSINDVGVIFQHIQALPINQYNEYLRVQKKKTRGGLVTSQVRSNMICFNKRFDGGQKKE